MNMPADLTTIAEESFYGSSSQQINLPAAVQNIESKAFAENPSLLLLVIPNADAAIAADAFENSENVTIMAPAGGTVQQFAEDYDIPFIPAQ